MSCPSLTERPGGAASPATSPLLGAAVLVLLGLVLPAAAVALSGDRDKPIEIEADRAELDDARGLNTYEGSVVATQGTLRITGDRLVIEYDPDRRIKRGKAFGNPATYEQLMDGQPEPARARALRMDYLVDEGIIELYDDALVVQGKDSLSGDRVTYDTVNGRVKAVRSGSGEERVRVTITPRSKAEPEPAKPR